jgi:hypothetical protein
VYSLQDTNLLYRTENDNLTLQQYIIREKDQDKNKKNYVKNFLGKNDFLQYRSRTSDLHCLPTKVVADDTYVCCSKSPL